MHTYVHLIINIDHIMHYGKLNNAIQNVNSVSNTIYSLWTLYELEAILSNEKNEQTCAFTNKKGNCK